MAKNFELISLLLKPAVRFCLRQGLHIQDILEATKWAFLELTAEELAKKGDKANVSRLSAATGIHRRDVMRLAKRGEVRQEALSLTSRVLGQWQYDKRFLDTKGTPRPLALTGRVNEFHLLVSRVSNDLNPGTLLFELERLGAVETTVEEGRQYLKLKSKAYVPKNDLTSSYRLLAQDMNYLASSVEQNIDYKHQAAQKYLPNLHATTEFDNIRLDSLPKIREWLLKEGSKFHHKLRNYLADFDLDHSPSTKSIAGGGRVVFSSFSLAETTAQVSNTSSSSIRSKRNPSKEK